VSTLEHRQQRVNILKNKNGCMKKKKETILFCESKIKAFKQALEHGL